MKVNEEIIKHMEWENFDMLTEIFMKVNGKMIKLMVKEFIDKQMEKVMTVIEIMIFKMDMVKKHEQMEVSMKDTIEVGKNMDMDAIIEKMAQDM